MKITLATFRRIRKLIDRFDEENIANAQGGDVYSDRMREKEYCDRLDRMLNPKKGKRK